MLRPWMGISLDEAEEVFDARALQGEVDGVEGLAAEGGVEHQRREGVGDGVAGYAVDFGGGVDLVDAVGVEEGAGGDLAGCGLLALAGGGKGEGGAGANAEHAGDDACVAHGDADDG